MPAGDRATRDQAVDEWYFQQNDATAGPFSWEELQYLQFRGRLSADDRVRRGANGPWIPAQSVRGLFPNAPRSAVASGSDVGVQRRSPQDRRPPQSDNAPSAALKESPNPDGETTQQTRKMPQRPPLPRRTSMDVWKERAAVAVGVGAGVVLILLILLALMFLRPTAESQEGLADGAGRPGSAQNAANPATSDPSETATEGVVPEPETEATPVAESKADSQPSTSSTEPEPTPPSATDESAASSTPAEAEAAPAEAALAEAEESQPTDSGPFTIAELESSDEANGDGGDAEFFGVKSKGNRIVYVVDRSGSMAGGRFEKACAELISSLRRLDPKQEFYVFFFSSSTYPMYSVDQPEKNLIKATRTNKKKTFEWIEKLGAGGGTSPQDALVRALELEPDVIYFLTDGEFDSSVVSTVRSRNRDEVVINTVAFTYQGGEALLKQIARENRGEYRFVP